MIITVAELPTPINVSVTGSSQGAASVSSQTVEPITLVVSTDIPTYTVSVPTFVNFANSAGSASYADTASYALASAGTITNAISSSYAETSSYTTADPFPYIGNAQITGTLAVTDKISSNKFEIDSLNGVFVLSGSVTAGIFGVTENIQPSIPMNQFSGAIIEYLARRDSGIRIGMVMGIWSGSTYTFTDISSRDIGDTSDLSTGFLPIGNNITFQVNSVGSGSGTWTVQSLFKLFPLTV